MWLCNFLNAVHFGVKPPLYDFVDKTNPLQQINYMLLFDLTHAVSSQKYDFAVEDNVTFNAKYYKYATTLSTYYSTMLSLYYLENILHMLPQFCFVSLPLTDQYVINTAEIARCLRISGIDLLVYCSNCEFMRTFSIDPKYCAHTLIHIDVT